MVNVSISSIERRLFMYPYNLYNYYDSQLQYEPQPYYPLQIDHQQYNQPEHYDPNRQFGIPGFPGRELERRVNELERRVNQLNREVNQLQQIAERHSRRLNRLNQRLRAVENKLSLPFTALEDGF